MNDTVAIGLERTTIIRFATAAKRLGIKCTVKPIFHGIDFDSNRMMVRMQTLTNRMFISSFETERGSCAISWHESGITRFHLLANPVIEKDVHPTAPSGAVKSIISRVQSHLEGDLQDFSAVE